MEFDEIDGEFDYIVVGGGGTAAAFIDTVTELRPDARILVLEQGRFLLPTHAQNLGLPYQPLMHSIGATPWTSDGDLEFAAQVPYLGGRTLVWSGSCPQPTRKQLRGWPQQIVDDLDTHWSAARQWLGSRPASELGPEFGSLHRVIRSRLARAAVAHPDLNAPRRESGLDAPLAYPPHVDGGRQKFAAIVPLLRAASRYRGVRIVINCPVLSLVASEGMVTALRTRDGDVSVQGATVVLAAGAAEATAIVLRSRPDIHAPRAGTNITVSAASFLTCRVPRAAFPHLSLERPELAAFYVNGSAGRREFHLHISAVGTAAPERDLERIYHLMPDMFGDGTPSRVGDASHVVLLIHGLCEVSGRAGGSQGSRLRSAADGSVIGSIYLDEADRRAWDRMDAAADAVLRSLSGAATAEFWNPEGGRWQSHPPARRLSTAFHETGSLAMGVDPDTSATDTCGRVHSTMNLFVLGGATFPTRGSWNPFLTMVALARRLAGELESRAPAAGLEGSMPLLPTVTRSAPRVAPAPHPRGSGAPSGTSLVGDFIAIIGATGTGKTDLSIALADRYREQGRDAEIINADAMQLYRGMDIGTAKVPLEERRGIPHHQLDVLEVVEDSNAAAYRERARADIDGILQRGGVAILVGGSGLYVSGVLYDLEFPGTDPSLRAALERTYDEQGCEVLLERLRAWDPVMAETIDARNPRRLVRALEIASLSHGVVPQVRTARPLWRPCRVVHLLRQREQLFPALQARAERMFRDGLVDEVAMLCERGFERGMTARTAHGYPQALDVLHGRSTVEEAVASTTRVTRAYARRQVRWFSRYPGAEPIDVTGVDRARLEELGRDLASVTAMQGAGAGGARRDERPPFRLR